MVCKHCKLNCPFCDAPLSRDNRRNATHELTVLMRPRSTVMAKQEVEEKIEKLGAKIVKQQVDGVKALSYPIHGNDKALYIYYEINVPDFFVANKLSLYLQREDRVIRYLFVMKDNR